MDERRAGPKAHASSPLGSSHAADGVDAAAPDVGPSAVVSYASAPTWKGGGLVVFVDREAARKVGQYLLGKWPIGMIGLHVDPTGRTVAFPPIQGYDSTVEKYNEKEQHENTIRVEYRRLVTARRWIDGFEQLERLALDQARERTADESLEVYDCHMLRQKNTNAESSTAKTPTPTTLGGSVWGAHRDNHDNPGKSQLQYSLSIQVTPLPASAKESRMQVLEPEGLQPLSYPRREGGAILFRSQALHASLPHHEGTVLKVVFFFWKRGKAGTPFTDHQQRPYFDESLFLSPAAYTLHRLGTTELGSSDVVTLGDVWQTATDMMPELVAQEEQAGGRRSRGKMVWTSGLCSSCCMHAVIDAEVAKRADACAPRSIFPPSRSSTAAQMAVQIGSCHEMDDMTWTMSGSAQRVNATQMAQPRRKSWSVLVDVQDDAAGVKHYRLFSYSQSYRPPSDWRAAPMPRPIFDLGVACWVAAWCYLSPISQVCPPTGCQLLAYLTVFNSCVGRHRDNGLLLPEGQHCRLGNTEDENSQIRGSSVLVYTAGPPMTFALSTPPAGKRPWQATKAEYEIQPALTVALGDGTLYVLDPRDDENCCHEAWFERAIIALGADVRRAYVFRWLSKRKLFFADGAGRDRHRCSEG